MDFHSSYRSTFCVMALTLGMATSTFLLCLDPILASASATAPANTSFPDTQNYWGQPFINSLAERNIVTGYPDNTYRPEQPVDRDEFAAILRQAFSQDPERQLSSGSVYKDISEGYWAAPAIQEAYEMGFMKGYPGGEFRPNQPVTKVEVLVSLAQNLKLPATTTETTDSQPVTAAPAAAPAATPQQPVSRPRVRRALMFPLALTTLMQPLVVNRAQATTDANLPSADANVPSAGPTPSAASTTPQRPVSLIVSDYYEDAAQIPQYAVDDVARTTEAGIVVNHPNPRMLNPNQPASRGEVAALIHQALVHQEKISPLPNDEVATNYIVGR